MKTKNTGGRRTVARWAVLATIATGALIGVTGCADDYYTNYPGYGRGYYASRYSTAYGPYGYGSPNYGYGYPYSSYYGGRPYYSSYGYPYGGPAISVGVSGGSGYYNGGYPYWRGDRSYVRYSADRNYYRSSGNRNWRGQRKLRRVRRINANTAVQSTRTGTRFRGLQPAEEQQ